MSTSHFATHLPEAPKKEWSYTSTPAPIRFHVVHSDDFTFVFATYFSTVYVLNILALVSIEQFMQQIRSRCAPKCGMTDRYCCPM
jgi:hypothetical protein